MEWPVWGVSGACVPVSSPATWHSRRQTAESAGGRSLSWPHPPLHPAVPQDSHPKKMFIDNIVIQCDWKIIASYILQIIVHLLFIAATLHRNVMFCFTCSEEKYLFPSSSFLATILSTFVLTSSPDSTRRCITTATRDPGVSREVTWPTTSPILFSSSRWSLREEFFDPGCGVFVESRAS